VVGRAFFVAGDQKGDRALVVRVVRHEAFGGHQHGGQAAFHVSGAAPAQHAVLVDQRIERVVLPGLHRAGRHHVGVTGKAQHRAVMTTVGGPEVVHVFNTHRFQCEAGITQALHHQLLAIGVDWRHGRATDQIAGKLQGRREVGVGRHGGGLRSWACKGAGVIASTLAPAGLAPKGGYLKAKRRPEAAV
jgi:hypothetical protein